ncbi:MAG: TOBE domain-containing protein [Pirellulales bacterium]|nr:TOBE domain-containing protein [Pirellulales bacterium]
MKISSRNVLEGTIIQLVHGGVHTEVTFELPGGQRIVSMITRASAQRLGLSEGGPVRAVIKASNVVLEDE